MALKKYTIEEIQKMSMIELANLALAEEKKDMNFIDLFHKVAELKNFTEAQRNDLLSRFYTDLNVDGRFTTLGANVWGLKRWYPVDQTSEKSLAESRKRDLEAAEYLEDEIEDEDTEEYEELDDDYKELDYDEDEDEE